MLIETLLQAVCSDGQSVPQDSGIQIHSLGLSTSASRVVNAVSCKVVRMNVCQDLVVLMTCLCNCVCVCVRVGGKEGGLKGKNRKNREGKNLRLMKSLIIKSPLCVCLCVCVCMVIYIKLRWRKTKEERKEIV